MLLTKEQILAVDDLPYRDVEVMEWKGIVRVRTMTGEERDALDSEIYEVDGDTVKLKRENYTAKLLARCLVGEDGKRLFSDKEILSIGGKSAKALKKLTKIAQDLNGMSAEVREDIEKK